ncbi:MerR family transcriptional regulator [Pseudarthrobacter sp. PS3-L1]|uniref:MerR family transcriptional regulator n=1 Tax=Pseudarthrobacter sp. PS3-L1 TaxID=3046207 RepID=UPI0024BACD48|nr:MerR family transcriptional regulator [Pseudarthrobacter sp. PS3-L1]MDJ0319057.1 MerR family transcriptional regulator [Pseudarthrobacter sp. PS3-L1]
MTDRASDTTMHIGELAERTGLSLRTIRHYDEVGLLPAASRTDGGFRVYAMGDVARLNLIKKMKPLGFSLEEMAELLEILGLLEDAAPIASNQRNALREFRERALTQRAKMARNLAQADDLIALMDS